MLPERILHYALLSIEGTPDVYSRLLRGLTDPEADLRPDPDRFTIREALAHVADWEGVFLQRMTATKNTDNAILQGHDEGQWAIDHDYAHADIGQQLDKFRAGRAQLTTFLRSLSPAQWERAGQHTEVGPITLSEQTLLVLAHDGYHARQFANQRSVGS